MTKKKTGSVLREVARLHDRLQRQTVSCCDTTLTQCQALTTLGRNGPMTLADLGRNLGLDKGWVSRTVESLASESLLTKQSSADDKRTIIISLSEEGERRLEELDGTLNGLSQRVMQRIPENRRAEVASALELLQQVLQSELNK